MGFSELTTSSDQFRLVAPYPPAGDQPRAISQLTNNILSGMQYQTLLGVTGSGKTFTMANVIHNLQRPALVIAHNKTLAAQLASEFQEFFPHNAVHYFVSYYDYYQPEAYIPRSDTYIEKDAQINEEIDRLRHATTQSLISRRDVVIVASISCIYGLGNPREYVKQKIPLKVGSLYPRRKFLAQLIDIQFTRNDIELKRGTFRVIGETIEIFPKVHDDRWIRLKFFGDELESIEEIHFLEGKVIKSFTSYDIFPATHYTPDREQMPQIINCIREELNERLKELNSQGKILEANRLQQRVIFDIDMLSQAGFVQGIENYSRYFDGRITGQPPYTLLDFFPKDYLLFVDESHVTIPQSRAMYAGDRSRKQNLVDYGFRLPSAFDNRPLMFSEFEERMGQTIFVSATPAEYELKKSSSIVEQVVRPTGLLDPLIEIHPIEGQVDDLIQRLKRIVEKGQRALVTTLTKKLAEDLTEYLQEAGIRTMYLHSDVDTFDRLETLRDLRMGVFDCIVGINLLREGLDLPEVSLVAILDADKEGFLRSDVSLIQTMGRAARHESGTVVMYADRVTGSMQRAIDETNRRRAIQKEYNKLHGIVPRSTSRGIRDDRVSGGKKPEETIHSPWIKISEEDWCALPPHLRAEGKKEIEGNMELASQNLEFEKAIRWRDKLAEIHTWEKKNPL